MEKKRLQELANINESYSGVWSKFHYSCNNTRQDLVKYTGGYTNGNYKDRRIAEFKKMQEKMEDLIEAIMG
jgi:hypothetical protein